MIRSYFVSNPKSISIFNAVRPYMIIALTFNTVVMQDFYLSYMYVVITKANIPIVCYKKIADF